MGEKIQRMSSITLDDSSNSSLEDVDHDKSLRVATNNARRARAAASGTLGKSLRLSDVFGRDDVEDDFGDSLISFGSTGGAGAATINEEEEMNDSRRLYLEGLVDSSSALERLDSLECSFSTMQMSASNMFESKLQAKLLQSLPVLIDEEEGGVGPVADGISKKNTEREETVNGAIRPWELLKTMSGEYTPSTNEGTIRARETFEHGCCGRGEQHKDTQMLKARESFEDRLRKKMSGESTLSTSDKWEPIASSSVAVKEARKVKARETFEQRLLKKMSGEYAPTSNTNQATNMATTNGKGGHPMQTRKPEEQDGKGPREGVAPREPNTKPTLSFCDLLEVKMKENRRAKAQREKPHPVCASFTAGVRLDKETGTFRRYDAQSSFEDQLNRSMSDFDTTLVRSQSTIRSKDSHLRKAVRDVESVPKMVETLTEKLVALESFEQKIRRKIGQACPARTLDTPLNGHRSLASGEGSVGEDLSQKELRKVRASLESFEDRLRRKLRSANEIPETTAADEICIASDESPLPSKTSMKELRLITKSLESFEDRIRRKLSSSAKTNETQLTTSMRDPAKGAATTVEDPGEWKMDMSDMSELLPDFNKRMSVIAEQIDTDEAPTEQSRGSSEVLTREHALEGMSEDSIRLNVRRAKAQREKPHPVCASFTAGVRLDKETGTFRRYDAQSSFEDQLNRSMSDFDTTLVRSQSTIRSKDSHLRKAVRDVESVPKMVETLKEKLVALESFEQKIRRKMADPARTLETPVNENRSLASGEGSVGEDSSQKELRKIRASLESFEDRLRRKLRSANEIPETTAADEICIASDESPLPSKTSMKELRLITKSLESFEDGIRRKLSSSVKTNKTQLTTSMRDHAIADKGAATTVEDPGEWKMGKLDMSELLPDFNKRMSVIAEQIDIDEAPTEQSRERTEQSRGSSELLTREHALKGMSEESIRLNVLYGMSEEERKIIERYENCMEDLTKQVDVMQNEEQVLDSLPCPPLPPHEEAQAKAGLKNQLKHTKMRRKATQPGNV